MFYVKAFLATFVLLLGFGLLRINDVNVGQAQMETPVTLAMLIAGVGTVLYLVTKIAELVAQALKVLVKRLNLNLGTKFKANSNWEKLTHRIAMDIWNIRVLGILPRVISCDSQLVTTVREHVQELGEDVFEQHFHLALEYILENPTWQRNQYGLRYLLGSSLKDSKLLELSERQAAIREKRYGVKMDFPMLQLTSDSL